MVGLGRLELPTSRLSGVRSNHLSYRPFSLAKRQNPQMANNTGDLPMRDPKGPVPEAHPIERETKTATSRFVKVTSDKPGLCSEDFLWMVRHIHENQINENHEPSTSTEIP